jgi:3-deoxy-D-manno-octulosonic acid kinase
MIERRSEDGRVRLVAEETSLDALVAAGLLADVPIERLRGAGPTPFQGRGRPVRLEVGGAPLIVKTLRHGGLAGRLLGSRFRDERRLLDAMALAQRLLAHGVATARPAFARVRAGALPGSKRLELATFEIEGARDAATFLAAQPPLRARRAAIRACGAAVRALHEAGVRHADLNLKNLLIVTGNEVRAYVIDLERSTLPRPLLPRHRVENLARLLRSTEKLGLVGPVVTVRDLFRFLAAYEPGARRELFVAVARLHSARAPWHRLAWRLFG